MEHIKRIEIYDFDSTLAISPENTQLSRLLWEKATGRKWKHTGQGWWSKLESLDYEAFDIRLYEPIKEIAKVAIKEHSVYTVLLTGRMPHFSKSVKEICRRNGLGYFDEYCFNDQGGTLDFKLKKIKEIADEYPHVKEMEMWDDRIEHMDAFKKLGESLYGSKFKHNLVKIPDPEPKGAFLSE